MVIGRYRPRIGGTEIQAERLARALVQKGIAVEVLTGRERGLARREQHDGVLIRRLWTPDVGIPLLNAIALWTGLLVAVRRRRNQFDVLHAHQAHYPAYSSVAGATHIGKPSVVRLTSSGERFDLSTLAGQAGPLGRHAASYLVRHASTFVALNNQVVADLKAWGVLPERIVLIPNGVEIPSPTGPQVRSDCRRRLHLPTDRSLILGVGNLRPEKNQAALIAAVQRIGRHCRKAALILLGDGPMRSALEAQARADDPGAQIIFPGRVNNVLDYLYAADLFVLPSLVEGLSNALIEAMAVGLPCAASDIPGNRMLIQNGINGLLFDPQDVEELTETVSSLLAAPQWAASLGYLARQEIQARYSMGQVADQYMSLYGKLTSG
jgi:glycosyltransferase involved in cell wall biosynthesis